MVAPAQHAPAPTPASQRGSSSGGAAHGSPAQAASDYDLTQAQADYTTLRQPLQNWMQEFLLPIDEFVELIEPTTPYVEILNEKGKNTVFQYIDPTMRNYQDATCAYIRADAIRVRCPGETNPGADQQDLSDTEAALRFVWQVQDEIMFGDFLEERKKLLCSRGMYFAQITLLDQDNADANYEGFPLRIDLHDPFDVAWDIGPNRALSIVIVVKRRTAGELYQSWRDTAGIKDPKLECDVVEVFTPTHHGALVNNQVAKPLTPHGYVDLAGNPAVPFVCCMHTPGMQRQGGAQPLTSGISQRGKKVGYPLLAPLLPVAKARSRVLTLLFHATKMTTAPAIEVKGLKEVEGENGVDLEGGIVEVEDTPSAGVRYVVPPPTGGHLELMLNSINQDKDSSSVSGTILQGQLATNVSGVAANHMTSWARSKAESLAITLERGLTAEAQMIVGNLRTTLVSSTASVIRRVTGKPPVIAKGEHSDLHSDGYALPFSERITGDPLRPIDDGTFKWITDIRVNIEADTRTPLEAEMAMAQQYAGAKTASGQPLVGMNWIRNNLMHVDNAAEVEREVLLEQAMMQQGNPYQQVKLAEAVLGAWESEIDDPQQLQSYKEQLTQMKQTALQAFFQQTMQSIQGQPAQPPGAPPPMNGMPPGMPPPSGPAPLQGPPAMGAPPPPGMMGGPPQPMPPPMQGPPPGGLPLSGGPPMPAPAMPTLPAGPPSPQFGVM